ncbi:MAG: virulence RhuM family protein [Bacteroidales bacterium]|nr:virulence RhuM family protein [Bacteroidales bacterium]
MNNFNENNKGEVILYQPNDTIRLEVRLENETVWLTQQQIADLFGTKRQAITKHLANIFKSGELDEISVSSILEHTASDGKFYRTHFYNLDAIISVGYRVNSINATAFRRWATTVLKQYLLHGHAIKEQMILMEDRLDHKLDMYHTEIQQIKKIQTKQQTQIDFFVRTSLPPVEGVFFDGQMWDAYKLVSKLIKNAGKRIILIDNYIDDSVLTLLDKRNQGVSAKIYTMQISQQLSLDISKHNSQCTPIPVNITQKSHDRFLIIDDDVYHIGASLKDLGKKWTAIMKMESVNGNMLLSHLK